MRCLVGGVGIDGARQHLRLVRHHSDRMAAEMGKRADDRGPELRLYLEPVRPSNTTSSTARMSYTWRLPRGTMSSSSGVERGSLASSAGSDGGYDHALDGKYDR